MTKKKMTAEEKAEELLMALGYELGESRAAFGEALMDENTPDPPMFMTEEDWEKDYQAFAQWIAEDDDDEDDWKPIYVKKPHKGKGAVASVGKRGSGKRRLRRAFLLVAVLTLTMSMMLVAVDGVKLKKNTMHMEDKVGESTQLFDDTKKQYDLEDFRVTYVPDGYELVEDRVIKDKLRIIRYRKADKGITISVVKTSQYGAHVDNEVATRQEVLVNDREAYLFADGESNFAVWQMGDCTIDISGRITQEEIVEVGKYILVD